MTAADLGIAAVDASPETNHWIRAAVILVFTFAFASLVDRGLQGRGKALAENVFRGELTREASTRLRFVRRLVYAGIVFLGVAFALSEFQGIHRLANSLLASGAIAAAIVGFAARQTLANLVAGVMLAITQPIRVGDWIALDDYAGVVEDIRLNHTVLSTPGGQRIVIPNERLAGGVLRNDTLEAVGSSPEVSLWLAPDGDVDRALAALAEETGHDASVAEVTPDGVRLTVSGDPVAPERRGSEEAALRAQCLRRLRVDGLLPGGTGERV
jgi:small-conductance mechanosensitive channel